MVKFYVKVDDNDDCDYVANDVGDIDSDGVDDDAGDDDFDDD